MCYIFQAHLHHGPPPNSDQNPAVTHAPLVLAIIIPKSFFFPSPVCALQIRTATVPFPHDALPLQLLRTARLDGFGIASSKTATALIPFPLHLFYLNLSEQFAFSFHCSALANTIPLLRNHGLLLFLLLLCSLFPVLLLRWVDTGVRPNDGVRGPRPPVVGRTGLGLLGLHRRVRG